MPVCNEIFGTPYDDVLSGTEADDCIYGLAGNDLLKAKRGNDKLYGDRGQDTLYGSSGNDQLFGGDDNDRLYGHDGSDVLNGGRGIDRMYGGQGYDTYYVDSFQDQVIEEPLSGTDWVYSSAPSYNLGEQHVNYLVLEEGTNAITGIGSSIRNQIYGNSNDNDLRGGGGDDYILGNAGDDLVKGDNGNDLLVGYSENDTVMGGSGNDTVVGYGWTAAEYDTLQGDAGADRFVLGISQDSYYLEAGFATITDFSRSQGDKIQINGSFDDYTLFPSGGDTWIYKDSDIIAVVLNRTNLMASDFVPPIF
jgi:Ca2+-binding RTX toxin-like protein